MSGRTMVEPRLYRPVAGHWDEALVRAGIPRRHWRKLSVVLSRMGPDQLARRWREGERLIRANGITYNVYGDPEGRERPWRMDPIPLAISAAEWRRIESAVSQRATLFNMLLADYYGEQRLLDEGVIPPALLFENPWFLRPCKGLRVPGGVYLHIYAVDMARSPGGDWWVISDRAQAPSGLGYALENRMVSARTLPGAFSLCGVRSLNHFFDRQRDAMLNLARPGDDSPGAVLLTSGPHNETYFEHSFLARQWGFPLAEGADLAVRDNRVFLKTLSGLVPVNLIVRRMDDTYCDPLELRGDSLLGVPGLTEAARLGHVTIANALGSGAIESPGYMAFLPGLCRTLLGEELRMPSVATWWCGQEEPLRYVLDHLNEVVIKPLFPVLGRGPVFPAQLSAAEREALRERIQASPGQWVAQEQVRLSTAPVRTEDGFTPRHVVLRVFAAWDGHGWSVLPGGLTRVSTADSSLVVSMQLGGGSKDTWVLANSQAPGDGESRRAENPGIAGIALGTGNLPSRVADNLFWLGRYAERVEQSVRLVRALIPGLSSEEDFGRAASVEIAVHLLQALGCLPPDELSPERTTIGARRRAVHRVLNRMVFDPSRTHGIGWNLRHVRRVLWPLKERLSGDTFRVLQELDQEFSMSAPPHPETRMVAEMNLLDRVVLTLSAFAGLLAENTTRGFGWSFLEIGKRIERAVQTAELLKAGLVMAPFEIEPYIETLLQIADSSITYRSRFFTALTVENLLELLVEDTTNPRAVLFQLEALREQIDRLPETVEGANDDLRNSVAELVDLVLLSSAEDLAARDRKGELVALDEFLEQLKTRLFGLSDALSGKYFSHVVVSRLSPYL
jgi:uncharacterized circularly permuted ATP-grasp superfamily protein/uncharacterized alpha-E superfamily protein